VMKAFTLSQDQTLFFYNFKEIKLKYNKALFPVNSI